MGFDKPFFFVVVRVKLTILQETPLLISPITFIKASLVFFTLKQQQQQTQTPVF